MKSSLILPLAVASVLLAAATIAQGVITERWFAMPEAEVMRDYLGRLDNVPKVIGYWEGSDIEMDELQREIAGIRGYVNRTYVDRRTGDQVSVSLVCGNSRHIAVHDPVMCYRAAGFTQERATEKYTIATDGGGSADFNMSIFKKEDELTTEKLRIFWSWNRDGEQWVAPSNARLSFVGTPAMYKLYLISPVPEIQQSVEESPIVKFSRDFLPALAVALEPPPAPVEAAEATP